MVSNRRQVIDRPSGVGKIFKDELEIATASYLIDVVQTMNVVRTLKKIEEIPGLLDARGRIQVL